MDTIVVEIGCASGLTMFSIASYVKEYIGTDMAIEGLKRNNNRIREQSIDNIKLIQCSADRIAEVLDCKVDIVIINSVCQYFPDTDYLNDVINKSGSILNPGGIIFIGDVLDNGLKSDFLDELKCYKGKYPSALVKLDRSDELWIDKRYFVGLCSEVRWIKSVILSGKECSIKNELTKYRYDVIIKKY